jgi:hypothetical protein
MPEYNSWCVDWVWFPREVRSEGNGKFLLARLRSGWGMTKT